jgi:hypothetical protein
MSKYDGISLFQKAARHHRIQLSLLVAETGIWASPEAHHFLLKENGTGAFFPLTRRFRKGELKGQMSGGHLLDDNTYANNAIKRAVGIKRTQITRFLTCHIWPQTCYDAKCHTVLANLVLLPAPLAGLSDHDPDIQASLQFRSYELYDWFPSECSPPPRPKHYPTNWADPMPFTDDVQRALRTRRS